MIAGEALNYLSIPGPLLGEPLKAAMVENVSFGRSLTSTITESLLNTVSAAVLTISGLLVLAAGLLYPTGSSTYEILAIFLLLSLLLVVLAALGSAKSISIYLVRIVHRIPGIKNRRWEDYCSIVEERFALLRRQRPGSLQAIFCITLVCQVLLMAEIVLVLWPLGYHLQLTTVLIVEAATKASKAAFFFVPARIGADEGSAAGVFLLLGMTSFPGLALVIVRRLRALVWSLAGLVFLATDRNQNRVKQEKSNYSCSIPPEHST